MGGMASSGHGGLAVSSVVNTKIQRSHEREQQRQTSKTYCWMKKAMAERYPQGTTGYLCRKLKQNYTPSMYFMGTYVCM